MGARLRWRHGFAARWDSPKTKRSANKMQEHSLTIVDFIRHPLLLNDQTNSLGQDVLLKSTYGLALSAAELELYCRGTGREAYPAREEKEVTAIAGRRGGKTSRIAARIALYEALRDHKIPRGERAYVMLIAPVLAQAKIAYNYILKDIF